MMALSRRFVALLPLLIFLLLACAFAFLLLRGGQRMPAPSPLVGQTAPNFTLTRIDGFDAPLLTPHHLASGKPVLLNFFASWCGPCRAEHPALLALGEEGVPIYGINYKDGPQDARRYLTTLGNPYRFLGADPKGRAGLALGITGVPESFVISGEGKILAHIPGPITEENLENVIRPALAQAAGLNRP
jgi:cytochrome c biogenesis protein CcmG/thiol:disulfide interchange protein DsbE